VLPAKTKRAVGALATIVICMLALPVLGTSAPFVPLVPSAPLARAQSPTRIHLHGSARIDAHAARAGGRLSLSGTVLDDTGRAIAGARVAVSVSGQGADAPAINLANAAASACSDGAVPPALESRDTLLVPTDDAARFCVRLSLPIDKYVAHLGSRAGTGAAAVAGAGALLDAARLDLPVDLALAPVTLRFDPEPAVLSLDDEGASFEVVASTEDEGVTTAAAGLPLRLSNETGAALGEAATNASGRARFAVDASRLGPPGHGELRVVFAGAAFAAPATHVAQVERRSRVDLSAPDAVEGTLPGGSPEDGIAMRVVAVPRCAKRGCAGVAAGTVEARVGDTVVGAGSLEAGEARVIVTFAMPPAESTALRLRYVPDAPWTPPAGELTVTLPLRAPSPWRKIPLLLAGLLAIGWLVLARLPPRKAQEGRISRAPRTLRPEAGVVVVQSGQPQQGWRGVVHDAHDGVPVAGARVAIERRGFERVEPVAHVWTDDRGVFVLGPLDVRPGDELVAEGPLHGEMRRPLPGPGELDVALVLRRRALIDRLVAWARVRGSPFDVKPEPTPGHVRRAAGAEFPVARWADAVERAAFGGQQVDAHLQAEVDRLAPASQEAPQRRQAEAQAAPAPRPRRPGAR
jgi:hypothetical protein